MYQYKQGKSESKRSQQPKSEAWSVRKPSTHRVSPYNKQETSQLLKADTSKGNATKFRNKRHPPPRPISSRSTKFLGAVKAALEKESRQFNTQLKTLEPTIKSLSPRFGNKSPESPSPNPSPGPNPNRYHHQTGKTKAQPQAGQYSPLFSKEDIANSAPLPYPGFPGEKLITVGGYIVSLQTAPTNITSIVRPRLTSDKDGFELEIKVLGCHPTDIKFEKRYDTLIVIGISKIPFKKPEEGRKAIPFSYGYLTEKPPKEEKDTRSTMIEHKVHHLSEIDHLDDMHEIINIFVPKHVSINQIFISKPDVKGRIFVKGP